MAEAEAAAKAKAAARRPLQKGVKEQLRKEEAEEAWWREFRQETTQAQAWWDFLAKREGQTPEMRAAAAAAAQAAAEAEARKAAAAKAAAEKRTKLDRAKLEDSLRP